MVYDVYVPKKDDVYVPKTSPTFDISYTPSVTHSIWNPNTSNTFYWTYPRDHYFYQLSCPKCKTKNWGEINVEVSCTKCSSTLKAVNKKTDFEIEVG